MLFQRDGKEHKGSHFLRKGKPHIEVQHPCSRCGGAGGADKWKHTGWTCYQCGGSGKGAIAAVRLYTAEELAKLNERAEKMAAKRQAKRDAAAAEESARIEREKVAVMAEHAVELEMIEALPESEFTVSLKSQIESAKRLSERQIEVLHDRHIKHMAEIARRAGSQHVGKVGERRTFGLTLMKHVLLYSNDFGAVYLTIAQDEDGNTISYKGQNNGLGFPLTVYGEGRDRYREVKPGAQVTIKATIKEHGFDRFTNEPITVVQRPKAA